MDGKKMLLVIDMLTDFIELEGALCCGPAAAVIVPRVLARVNEFIAEGNPVIYIMDSHAPDDLEFTKFPPHCIRDTGGARLIADLENLAHSYSGSVMVTKQRYSGFYNTRLDEIIAGISPAEVHVVGVCTNICVLYTVEELCNRDLKTIVYRDAVASFDEEAHQWALSQMETVLGAEIR